MSAYTCFVYTFHELLRQAHWCYVMVLFRSQFRRHYRVSPSSEIGFANKFEAQNPYHKDIYVNVP